MKKVFFTIILLFFSSFLVHADVKIEKNDTLKIYIIDYQGIDIILGSFTSLSAAAQSNDPHLFKVSLEGRIFIPNIGAIIVEGKTTSEIEQIIKTKFTSTTSLKEVAVLMMTEKTNQIYVLGEVLHPGMYRTDQTKPYENKLMNLINMAGGFTDRAGKDDIRIMKENGQVVSVNIFEMINHNALKENINLDDKDTIIVGQGVSRVYVIGEVKQAGPISYLMNASYTDYIAEAGGLNNTAEKNNIGIIRRTKDKNMIYRVSMDESYLLNNKDQITLLPGDIIYVARSFMADWKDLSSILGIARDSIYIYDTIKK